MLSVLRVIASLSGSGFKVREFFISLCSAFIICLLDVS